MLTSLLIKDYALIENISVEFKNGLNIITGETGAGKSILIDAMGLLLGERASSQVVRKGSKKSVVEGIFEVKGNKKVEKLLAENDIESGEELIVRREISLKGSNRCFINDTPVPLSTIQEMGHLLVDLHGQHDHQSLLRSSTHIHVLDDFAETNELLYEYKSHHSKISELSKELFLLKGKEKTLSEEKEAFAFQFKEIEAVDPQLDEEEDLKNQLNILENAERLVELTNSVYSNAYDDENSVNNLMSVISNNLSELSNIDESFNEKFEEIKSVQPVINDISDFVRDYRDKIDLESNRLEEVRERLGSLNLLKKRYGGSIEKVIEHKEKLSKELKDAENFDSTILELEKQLEDERIKTGKIAKTLSLKRIESGIKIETEVVKELEELGIQNSQFEVRISNIEANEGSEKYIYVEDKKYKFNAHGYDEIEFFIATNLGEDLKPLSKVASGGEISRIMLALKSILAKSDKLPLLIFDEIDSGVSGRIAQKVGESLKSLSTYHQIISITHLAQIASLAESHYSVEKADNEDRVVSSIRKLNNNERVIEVAKLLSGEKITEASLISAREMIGIN